MSEKCKQLTLRTDCMATYVEGESACSQVMKWRPRAFGLSKHKADVSAQIEAWLIRFKTRKDHHKVAVRAEGALASRFSMEKRGDGTV